MADQHVANSKPRPLINGRFPNPPFWLMAGFFCAVCTTWLVLTFAWRARTTRQPEPRVHFIQDMDNQTKYKAQSGSTVFADGRASRQQVPGTVARGRLDADDAFFHGYNRTWNAAEKKWDVTFVTEFPEQFVMTDALLKRGQAKFNTYCMPCHGYDGQGNGPINYDAVALQASKNADGMSWVNPSNMTDEERRKRPDGHLYNTITNGVRNMAGYSAQIPDARDRWAIVAYVRALQLSHQAPASMVAGGEKPVEQSETAAR